MLSGIRSPLNGLVSPFGPSRATGNPIIITATPIENAVQNATYSFPATATGGDGSPLTGQIIGPPGLVATETAPGAWNIEGPITEYGTFPGVIFRVTDEGSGEKDLVFNLTVRCVWRAGYVAGVYEANGAASTLAGVSASTRNIIVRDINSAGDYQSFAANTPAVTDLGAAVFGSVASLNANGTTPNEGVTGWFVPLSDATISLAPSPPYRGIFTSLYVASGNNNADGAFSTGSVALAENQVVYVKFAFGPGADPSGRVFVRANNSLARGVIGAVAVTSEASGSFEILSQSSLGVLTKYTTPTAGNRTFRCGPDTTTVGKDIRMDGIDVTDKRCSGWVSNTSPAPTRLAENLRSVPGTDEPVPGWGTYGLDSAFNLLIDFNVAYLTANAVRTLLDIPLDADNSFKVTLETDNTVKAVLRIGGSDVVTMASGALTTTGNKTAEIRIAPEDSEMTVTGVSGDTDATDFTMPAFEAAIYQGSNSTPGEHFNGSLRDMRIWPVGA